MTRYEAFIIDPYNPETNFWLGEQYYLEGYKAAALSYFLRAAEYGVDEYHDLVYEALIKVALCLKEVGGRPHSTRGAFLNAITYDPSRPEGYYHLSYDHQVKEEWQECYLAAVQGLDKLNHTKETLTDIDYPGEYALIFQKGVSAWWVGQCDESRTIFQTLLKEYPMAEKFTEACYQNLSRIWGLQYLPLPYKKEDHSKLRYKFKDSKKIEKNYSQVYQDMFVLSMLDGKKNGTYLEIGASDPIVDNNTYLLETEFEWKGISVEIEEGKVKEFNQERTNQCLQADATKLNYTEILEELETPKTVDYLQVDCEPAETTFNVLLSIPFDKYKFAVITFEHDYYLHHKTDYRKASRKYLESLGYKRVVSNIAPDSNSAFEDWWIHPDLVDAKIVEKMTDLSEETKRADHYMLPLN